MPWYGLVVCRAHNDLIWSNRNMLTRRNPETHIKKQRYTRGMATYTHIHKTHDPLLLRTQESGWDGPSTQSHSKPIKADDSSDIYTIHPLPLPPLSLTLTHTQKGCLQFIVTIIVTASLTEGGKEKKREGGEKKWRGCSH